jgi:hypothetical protein
VIIDAAIAVAPPPTRLKVCPDTNLSSESQPVEKLARGRETGLRMLD